MKQNVFVKDKTIGLDFYLESSKDKDELEKK